MLNNRLKSLRENKNLLLKEVAKEIGVSTSTISMYELGHREPSNDILKKLAEFYNVSTDYLLGKDEMIKSEYDEILFKKTKNLSDNDKKLVLDIIDTIKNKIDEEEK